MPLLSTIFIFAIPAVFGTAVFTALKLFREKITLLLTGTIFGLTIFTALAFIVNPLFSLNTKMPLFLLLVLLAATIYLLRLPSTKQHWQKCHLDKTALIILLLLLGLFSLIAPKLLIDKPEGLHTGVINAYGDIGWHMSNITLLKDNQSLIPQNPILAGTSLAYPFLPNLFSAILLATGASFSSSVTAPALILIPLLMTLFYCLSRTLTSSKTAAVIALLLFLFGGSTLGWISIANDWSASGQSFTDFFTHLSRNVSGHSDNPDGFYLINSVVSLLLPQRSFLFGMPLAFTILLLLLKAKNRGAPAFIIAGILSGLLPLFHAHTVLSLIPVILALVIINFNKKWFYFVITAGIIGLPQLLLYKSGFASTSTFIHLQLGWMSAEDGFILFWLKNTGFILPAVIFGLIQPAKKEVKAFALSALLIFISANIWLFAPWEWDNTKLFVYWLLFSLPLVGWVCTALLRSKALLVPSLVIAAIIFHIISGGLDIFQLVLPDSPSWQVWSKHDISFAKQIRAATQPNDAILTAPIHNSAVALAGRAHYLGYPGHVWTHGGNHADREQSVKQYYEGTSDTLAEITPAYVLVGPSEKYMYPTLVIRSNWQLVAQQENYALYKL